MLRKANVFKLHAAVVLGVVIVTATTCKEICIWNRPLWRFRAIVVGTLAEQASVRHLIRSAGRKARRSNVTSLAHGLISWLSLRRGCRPCRCLVLLRILLEELLIVSLLVLGRLVVRKE